MKLVAVLCLLVAAAVQVYAMPNGAPAAACTNISPGGPHLVPPAPAPYVPNSADQSMNPFEIDLSQFQCPTGLGYCYAPGQTYQLTLSGRNCSQFRGLLVQARQNGTGDPVGTFVGFTDNTRESDCTPNPERAVTHSNPSDKTLEVLYWIAPTNETGHIAFHYAVVVILQQGAANIWYAPAYTHLIYENENATVGPPASNDTCPPPVQSCPVLTVDNGTVTYTPQQIPPLVGATGTYTCDPGFQLRGESVQTCLGNGTWTGMSTCGASNQSCPVLTVENGMVTYTPQQIPPIVGAIGTYTCDPGFPLNGEREQICQGDGTWTGMSTCGASFTAVVSIWSLLALLVATYLL